MVDPRASLVSNLYGQIGGALELASTSVEDAERAYWSGQADAWIETVAYLTDQNFANIKADIVSAYDGMSLADRVNEVFGA